MEQGASAEVLEEGATMEAPPVGVDDNDEIQNADGPSQVASSVQPDPTPHAKAEADLSEAGAAKPCTSKVQGCAQAGDAYAKKQQLTFYTPESIAKAGSKTPTAARAASAATTAVLEDVPTSISGSSGDPSQPASPSFSLPASEVEKALAAVRAFISKQPKATDLITSSHARTSMPSGPAKKKKKGKYDDTSSEEEEQRTQQKHSTGPPEERGRINLQQLQELLQAAQATVDSVKNKDVILILGRTGVGKSTLIQRLSGRALHRTRFSYQDQEKGGDAIELKNVFEVQGDPLEGFEIGHESKSKTKHIKHFSMKSLDSEKEVVYLDSSGFGDSSGVEADIATSLSVKRVAETCRSLRFVVLVHFAAIAVDRGAGVRSLMDLVRGFVEDFQERKLSFTFLFTHVDSGDPEKPKTLDELRQTLQDHLGELRDSTMDKAKSTKEVVRWLGNGLRKKRFHLVDVFHPLDSDVRELRRGLEKFEVEVDIDEDGERIEESSAIGLLAGERCSDIIKCGLTMEAAAKIAGEMKYNLDSIERWLAGNEYERLSTQMGVLTYLAGQMDDVEDVQVEAKKIERRVAGHAKHLLDEAYKVIASDVTTTWPATSIAQSLRNLASADAYLRLPLRDKSILAAVGLEDEEEDEDVKMKAVKAVLHLARRLQDVLLLLQAPPLGKTSFSSDSERANYLLRPLAPATFQRLEHLGAWAQGVRASELPLPCLAEVVDEGTTLVKDYADELLKLLRDASVADLDYASQFQLKVSCLARLNDLGSAPTASAKALVHFETVHSEADTLEGLLKELCSNTADEAHAALTKGIDVAEGTRTGAINKDAQDASVEATFEPIQAAVAKFCKLGACISAEKEVLPTLNDCHVRGLATVEQTAERLVQSLEKAGRAALRDPPENGPLPELSKLVGDFLRRSTGALSPLPAKGKAEAALLQYRDDVNQVVLKWESELNVFWKKGRGAAKRELIAINEQVALFKSLIQAAWKNQLVPEPTETLTTTTTNAGKKATEESESPGPVEDDTIEKLRAQYTDHIVNCSKQVEQFFRVFLENPFKAQTRDSLLKASAERDQAQAFAELCPSLVGDFEQLRTLLCELLETWTKDQLTSKFDDQSSTLDEVLVPTSTFARELEVVLLVCHASDSIPKFQEILASTRKETDRRVKWLASQIDGLRGCDGKFATKKAVLDSLLTWNPTKPSATKGKEALKHVCSALPSFEDFAEKIGSSIADHTRRVRDELAATGKMAEADKVMEALEEALVLDGHLKGLVKRELKTTKENLAISRTDFEDSWKTKLEACDFEGMGEQLEALADSKSKEDTEKAKEKWKHICARVEREETEARANIDDGEKAAASMEKLQKANHELQPLLKKLGGLNLEKILTAVQRAMNNFFKDLLAKFKSAHTASKLPLVLEYQRDMLKYQKATKRWLTDSVQEDAKKARADAAQCLKAVDFQVSRFIENLDKEPKDRADTAELIDKLRQLHDLTKSASPADDGDETADEEEAVDGGVPAPEEQEEPSTRTAAAAAASSSHELWVVTAGKHGGIRVSLTEHYHSEEARERLQHGSIVAALGMRGDKLHYQLVDGKGPATGWIKHRQRGWESVTPIENVWIVTAPKGILVTRSSNRKFPRVERGCLIRITKTDSVGMHFARLSEHKAPDWGVLETKARRQLRRVGLDQEDSGEEDEWEEEAGPTAKNTIKHQRPPFLSTRAVKDTYTKSTQKLSSRLNQLRKEIKLAADNPDPALVTRAVSLYQYLVSESHKGLGDHLDLDFSLEDELERAKELSSKRYSALEKPFTSVEEMHGVWSHILRHMPTRLAKVWQKWYDRAAYEQNLEWMLGQARRTVEIALEALDSFEYAHCGNQCLVAWSMGEHLRDHPTAHKDLAEGKDQLLTSIRKHLDRLTADLYQSLNKNNIPEFEQLLFRLYKFVKYLREPVPRIMEGIPSLNTQIAQQIETRINRLWSALDNYQFPAAKDFVENLRQFGKVLSGVFVMYADLIRDTDRDDVGVKKLNNICSEYFRGRELEKYGRYYALLEVPPGADQEDIERAHRTRSLDCHPDNRRRKGLGGNGNEQKELDEALEQLSQQQVREAYRQGLKEPFSDWLKMVPGQMRTVVEQSLKRADYEMARKVMVAARDLRLLADLVEIDEQQERSMLEQIIKEHINELDNNVTMFWDTGELRKLNSMLERLDKVNTSFSAHSDVYNAEWNGKIRAKVTARIEEKAQDLAMVIERPDVLTLKRMAEGMLTLGRLMDEIPMCKGHASITVEQILDQCQESFGASFIFQLGMHLEQGKAGRKDQDGNVDPNDQRLGRVVVTSFRQFRDIGTVIWNKQTSTTQKDLASTVKEIEGYQVLPTSTRKMQVNRDELTKAAHAYNEHYQEFWRQYKAKELDLKGLVAKLKEKAQSAHPCSVSRWNSDVKAILPELLAGIGAFFTISKSGESFCRLAENSQKGAAAAAAAAGTGAGEKIDAATILQKPHTIQILTLLRLFAFDSDLSTLPRQLMQIRTGEGKSMILGMSSLLFALLGFRVRCICYSEYLSERDYKLFSDMFEAFAVKELVTYSKITKFSEDKVAEKGDIRELTKDMLIGKLQPPTVTAPPSTSTAAALEDQQADADSQAGVERDSASTSTSTGGKGRGQKRSREGTCQAAAAVPEAGAEAEAGAGRNHEPEEILLLDEVDMFFGSDFYGRTHDQVSILQMAEVGDLLQLIWKYRFTPRKQLLDWIMTTQPYQQLSDALEGFGFVVEREVAQMCDDVREFENPPYTTDAAGNRIGYKELDGICYDIVYGYRTAFAYLQENDKRTFQNGPFALSRGLRLRVSCGQFCYHKIKAACILGVSGTLSALGKEEWGIMRQYKIDSYTMMPSVYGQSNFKWWNQEGIDPITVTSSRAEHFAHITEQVKWTTSRKRAAIVLFESAEVLWYFEQSDFYQQIDQKSILSESKTYDEKEFVIKKAATAGQATFTTAVFGRGTDFMCNDDLLLDAGGVHIIHAFFSLNKSEEEQIQGRTARQGKKGTYCMVLCDPDLQQQFGFSRPLAGQFAPKELYALLDRERTKLQRTQHEQIEAKLELSEQRDALTRKYFEAIRRGDARSSRSSFKDLYKEITAAAQQSSRGGRGLHIVFCLDRSRSMEGERWEALRVAYEGFLAARGFNGEDRVSVVVFNDWVEIPVRLATVSEAYVTPFPSPYYGTKFRPAIEAAQDLFDEGAGQYDLAPVLLFMSDGCNADQDCCGDMLELYEEHPDLQCHTIFFGDDRGADHLYRMSLAVPGGQFHHDLDGIELQETFKSIAISAEYTR